MDRFLQPHLLRRRDQGHNPPPTGGVGGEGTHRGRQDELGIAEVVLMEGFQQGPFGSPNQRLTEEESQDPWAWTETKPFTGGRAA